MSKNIVFEGWLTKSPPTKRIWRTKWRRRWFALRQSGELPGQYFLDYYADRNCRRLKGTINLDLCEQVDAGLHMERSNNVTLDPKLRGSVFTIQTQSRTYHLEADCEADMVKWVDAICRVCGLQPKDNSSDLDAYQDAYRLSTIDDRYRNSDTTGPYIPISECITGVRAQNSQKAFTFDTKNIVISTRRKPERVPNRNNQMYLSQPHIRFNNGEFSENESNFSDEDCKSLNASQSNIRNWTVAKTYTKNTPTSNKYGEYQHGPPVPPRPPKTLAMSKEFAQKKLFCGSSTANEKNMTPDIMPQRHLEVICHQPRRRLSEIPPNPDAKVPGRVLRTIAPPSPGPAQVVPDIKITDEDEERLKQSAMQYSNLVVAPPPAVDRALKPRHSSYSIGNVNSLGIQSKAAELACGVHGKKKIGVATNGQCYVNANYFVQRSSPQLTNPVPERRVHAKRKFDYDHSDHLYLNLITLEPPSILQLQNGLQFSYHVEAKPDVLQYLDLDLHTSKPTTTKDTQRKTIEAVHGKSLSAVEAASAYKTVDFLKTEAFNITRQDAEASRNSHH